MTFAVARVERELSRLRHESARAGDADNLFPDVRAAVATLVIWAGDTGAGEEASAIATQVATRHPCRSVVVVPGQGGVDAQATASCALMPAGEYQLCCEQIVLRGGTVAQAASAAEQLLLPDVPVVLWSLDGALPGGTGRLLEAADRVLYDTHYSEDPFEAARSLCELAGARPGLWVADLDWGRLTPWRALLAQFFDAPGLRHHLDGLERVELHHVGRGLRPFLLAGWLLDRLRLPPGSVELEVNEVEDGRGLGPGHLLAAELSSATGSFTVQRGEDVRRLEARADVPEERLAPRSLPIPGPDRARALAEELAQVGQDPAFLGALRLALELAPRGPAPAPQEH